MVSISANDFCHGWQKVQTLASTTPFASEIEKRLLYQLCRETRWYRREQVSCQSIVFPLGLSISVSIISPSPLQGSKASSKETPHLHFLRDLQKSHQLRRQGKGSVSSTRNIKKADLDLLQASQSTPPYDVHTIDPLIV